MSALPPVSSTGRRKVCALRVMHGHGSHRGSGAASVENSLYALKKPNTPHLRSKLLAKNDCPKTPGPTTQLRRISDHRGFVRTGRVSAACSTHDFRYPVSGRRGYAEFGAWSPAEKILFLAPKWLLRKALTTRARASRIDRTIRPARLADLRCQLHGAGAHRLRPAPGSVPGTRAISSY